MRARITTHLCAVATWVEENAEDADGLYTRLNKLPAGDQYDAVAAAPLSELSMSPRFEIIYL